MVQNMFINLQYVDPDSVLSSQFNQIPAKTCFIKLN
jgi:hypothetical protein